MSFHGRAKFVLLSVMCISAHAWAHTAQATVEISDWTWPAPIVTPMLLTLLLYVFGTVKMLRRAGKAATHRRSVLYFAVGWLSLVIALDSPIHELGEQLFWVHMTQHEILMLVSSPLL